MIRNWKRLALGCATLAALCVGLLAVLALFDKVPAPIRNAVIYLQGPPLSLAELGDDGPASQLRLFDPGGLARNAHGDIFISDRGRDFRGRMVWRIDAQGHARAVAGNGRRGNPRAGIAARGQPLASPEAMAIGPDGLPYFADSANNRVYRIARNGVLQVVAGSGELGFAGDGGLAVDASLYKPYDIAFDQKGLLYIVDTQNHRIRKVDQLGRISTVAGNGAQGFSGDGGPAEQAQLDTPYGVAIAADNSLLIADSANHRVRRVDSSGIIQTIAGTGKPGMSGNNGPAIDAEFDSPQALAILDDGRLVIDDEHNHMLRIMSADGEIKHLAGTGESGSATPGTLTGDAALNDPEAILPLPGNRLLVTEGDNNRVLLMPLNGPIKLFAGSE